jgi:hypothetical protein
VIEEGFAHEGAGRLLKVIGFASGRLFGRLLKAKGLADRIGFAPLLLVGEIVDENQARREHPD